MGVIAVAPLAVTLKIRPRAGGRRQTKH
jgi:hypothetical protein